MSHEMSGNVGLDLISDTVWGYRADFRNRSSPITIGLVLLITFIFLFQEALAHQVGTTVPILTKYLFVKYPVEAWLLSFFMHNGFKHFLANITFILLVGQVVEGEFTKRQYLLLILGVAVLTTIGAYLFDAPFTSKPIADYGASGFAVAISVYALYYPYREGRGLLASLTPQTLLYSTSPAERIAFVLGVSVIIGVTVNLLTGPYFTPEWANGAHTVGALIGLVVGKLHLPSE